MCGSPPRKILRVNRTRPFDVLMSRCTVPVLPPWKLCFLVLTSFFRKREIGEESLVITAVPRACLYFFDFWLSMFSMLSICSRLWDRGKEKGEKYIYIETWYEVCGYMRFIDYNTYVFLDRLFTTNLLVSALY